MVPSSLHLLREFKPSARYPSSRAAGCRFAISLRCPARRGISSGPSSTKPCHPCPVLVTWERGSRRVKYRNPFRQVSNCTRKRDASRATILPGSAIYSNMESPSVLHEVSIARWAAISVWVPDSAGHTGRDCCSSARCCNRKSHRAARSISGPGVLPRPRPAGTPKLTPDRDSTPSSRSFPSPHRPRNILNPAATEHLRPGLTTVRTPPSA